MRLGFVARGGSRLIDYDNAACGVDPRGGLCAHRSDGVRRRGVGMFRGQVLPAGPDGRGAAFLRRTGRWRDVLMFVRARHHRRVDLDRRSAPRVEWDSGVGAGMLAAYFACGLRPSAAAAAIAGHHYRCVRSADALHEVRIGAGTCGAVRCGALVVQDPLAAADAPSSVLAHLVGHGVEHSGIRFTRWGSRLGPTGDSVRIPPPARPVPVLRVRRAA
jgi:hypothetical protein